MSERNSLPNLGHDIAVYGIPGVCESTMDGIGEPTERCGECENCKKLEKVKASVLRAANPPFSHADQGTVDLWNAELSRLPCLGTKEKP